MNHTQRLSPREPLRQRSSHRVSNRVGAATVELALSLPVLLVISMGMMETCNVMLVEARMQSAAYEAARLAIRPTTAQSTAATSAQVTSYCTTLLSQLGVKGAQIVLNPSDLSTLAPLSMVTVTITAPIKQNSVTTFVLSNSMTITAQATMVFE
jgi:Flp pilus assembly protein TadG